MEKYVSVIGGINIDIKGRPFADEFMGNCNPGQIHLSSGGVARNIAENLARLDIPVMLLGAAGDDYFGRRIIEKTRKAGVNIKHLKICKDIPTGIFLSILDKKGEMAIGVSDMKPSDTVTEEYINSVADIIKGSSFIITDTNIPAESMEIILKKASVNGIPVIVEPVSIQKAKKIKKLKGRIHYLTLNTLEFQAVTGYKTLPNIKTVYNMKNIEDMIITMGAAGVLWLTGSPAKNRIFNALPAEIKDVNGAGDAFTGGFVYGLFSGASTEESIRLGLCASAITLKSGNTVSGDMSVKLLKKLYSDAYEKV